MSTSAAVECPLRADGHEIRDESPLTKFPAATQPCVGRLIGSQARQGLDRLAETVILGAVQINCFAGDIE